MAKQEYGRFFRVSCMEDRPWNKRMLACGETRAMKEYTYVVLNTLTGDSQVLWDFPGFNPRAKRAFESLTNGPETARWRPVRETPMGNLEEHKHLKTRVNSSVLILLERDLLQAT
jgi:hypothetical protein